MNLFTATADPFCDHPAVTSLKEPAAKAPGGKVYPPMVRLDLAEVAESIGCAA